MYTLKPASLFRPSSRPTSPVPTPRQDTPVGDRPPRPLSKLSLSNFKRPSPAPPSLPEAATKSTTVVQDGSFMEVLGLKLSEAVSKALAQPAGPALPGESLAGRRPLPSGRGRILGAIIVSETKAAQENLALYRAVIRTLQRPLSVLLTNLSNNLIPLISSEAFQAPVATNSQDLPLNATQLHAVAYATLAGELLETFDQISLGVDVDTRGESIKVIRDRLLSIVKRVVDPLLNVIKGELLPLIEALETVASPTTTGIPAARGSGAIKSPMPHPSIMTLQIVTPIYARALTRIVASAYAESALASLLISLVWRGMVALSHRPTSVPTPPSSPSISIATLKTKESKKTLTTLTSTPTTPPSSRFVLKLPPSRPPSPPAASRGPTVAADALSLYNLFDQLPKPSAGKEQTRLAREVVHEAFDGLSALVALLESIQAHVQTSYPHPTSAYGTNASPKMALLAELEADLELLTVDLPVVIALPVLLRTYLPATGRSVSSILGLAEAEYRKDCLSGFGRAEECGVPVGQRVLDVLRADPAVKAHEKGDAGPLLRWLERELEMARAEREESTGHMH